MSRTSKWELSKIRHYHFARRESWTSHHSLTSKFYICDIRPEAKNYPSQNRKPPKDFSLRLPVSGNLKPRLEKVDFLKRCCSRVGKQLPFPWIMMLIDAPYDITFWCNIRMKKCIFEVGTSIDQLSKGKSSNLAPKATSSCNYSRISFCKSPKAGTRLIPFRNGTSKASTSVIHHGISILRMVNITWETSYLSRRNGQLLDNSQNTSNPT